MPLVTDYCELGMATELAKVVAGATGGIPNLTGTFTLNGATNVVVNNNQLQAGDQIIYTLRTVGGTVGAHPSIKTRTNGTGFAVSGTAGDTSIFDYRIFKA